MLRVIFYNIVSFFIIILIFEIILKFLPVNQGFRIFMKLIKIVLFSELRRIEALLSQNIGIFITRK